MVVSTVKNGNDLLRKGIGVGLHKELTELSVLRRAAAT